MSFAYSAIDKTYLALRLTALALLRFLQVVTLSPALASSLPWKRFAETNSGTWAPPVVTEAFLGVIVIVIVRTGASQRVVRLGSLASLRPCVVASLHATTDLGPNGAESIHEAVLGLLTIDAVVINLTWS